jgi:hypothetical protein
LLTAACLAICYGSAARAASAPTPTESVTALPLRLNANTQMPSPVWPTPGLTLYVAPTGKDTGTGSAADPFGSLERARDEIRKRGPLPAGGVEVLVHGGEYQVRQNFSLTEHDSGTESSRVVFRAVPGERPIFRGGTKLSGWHKLSEKDSYPLLPADSLSKVWICDLRTLGITNLLPLKLGGFASGNGFQTHPAHELFFNGQAMTLARGPNEGFLHISKVAAPDDTKGYDREGSKTGKFFCADDRISRWANEPDLLLYGYWFWDWADSYERVASIDPGQWLITLAQPWHNYGFSVGAPFYAVNALSELDAPGEWYLDRQGCKVLLYPPSDPMQATIELSQFDSTMVSLEKVSWVTFAGLTWELGSADAIKVNEGAHCLFAGCVVRRFAGNGIELIGGQQNGIRSCDIYSMGRGGTVLIGGNRKTLAPGGHYLENCDIHDLSRIDHTYTPAVLLDGVGNRIAHNRMHGIRSSAMRVGGNDHVIEYNEVYNAVTESDDQGGADMWGNPTYRGNVFRYNYWHHIGNWQGEGEQPKCGQAGIRLDDAISGTMIFGNVFDRCSAGKLGFGGVQIHGGKDNAVEHNLFINCAAMLSCSPWDDKRWREFTAKSLQSDEIDRELYLKKYPELATLSENVNRNHVRGNLAWHCGELLRHAPGNLDAHDNSTLKDSEIIWQPGKLSVNRPGFDPIPFVEIGLYADGALRE